jgi:undecaprenyl-diphosphatase
MDYLQVLILALIQGAAELLPVSSSAHVIVAARLMRLDPADPRFVFLLVMLHTGTMFAVLVYFWPRWKPLLWPPAPADGDRPDRLARHHFLLMVVLASAVTGVLGFGLKEFLERVVLEPPPGQTKAQIEVLFRNLYLIAASLFLVGLLIIAAGRHESRSESRTVTPRSALWVGLVQALCLPFRGFSRSGATISTGLFCGVARPLAEDFSFALAVVLTPAVIGHSALKLLHVEASEETELFAMILPGLVGMVFSLLAGLAALRLLSAVLEKGRWRFFGYYCLAAAAVVLTAALGGL